MTNEELALRIRAGEKELEEVLWERISRLLYLVIDRFMTQVGGLVTAAGVERADLEQESYFAMLEAVEAYDPEKGHVFNTYLTLQCRRCFYELLGLRSGRQDPLNTCLSLDEPLGSNEDESYTRGDIIPDPQDIEEDTIERMWQDQLRDELDAALSMLVPVEGECIRRYYLNGEKQSDIARDLGVPYQTVHVKIRSGFRSLRTRKSGAKLRKYRESIIDRYAYNGSYTIWKENGASSTEYTALKLMEAHDEEA